MDTSVGFMENAETLQQGAIRETFEETGSHAKVIQPYTLFSLPHINQVHMFFLAELLDENFGPTTESQAVELHGEDEILWDQIAFPTVEKHSDTILLIKKKISSSSEKKILLYLGN